MNEIQKLSDETLNNRLIELVKKEREILSEVLLHIQEVDTRRLYLKLAYGNLFDYLTKHLGYSAGSAQRRIDAARLGKEVQSVVTDLETGALNLAQVGLLQKSIRRKGRVISSEVKVALLEKMKHKTFQESQVLIARDLDIEIQQSPRTTCQADESVRLEVTLSKEQWQKLEKMRTLLSHSLPNGSWDQVLEYVADKVISSRTKTREGKNNGESKKTNRIPAETKSESHDRKVAEAEDRSSTFSVLRKKLIRQAIGCQFQHAGTGRVCGSKWQLQIDHLKPRWAGGNDVVSNLQVLCANHNRFRYQEQAGIRRISK